MWKERSHRWGGEVGLGDDIGVGDGDVGAAVHNSRLFYARTSSWSEGGGAVCGLSRVDGGVEEGFGCRLAAFHSEGFVAVVLIPGLTAASSESASSSGAVGMLWLE